MKITKKLSFGIAILASLIFGFYVQTQIGSGTKAKETINNLSPRVKELIGVMYPKDLVIKITNGKVAINQKLPYCVVYNQRQNLGVVFDSATSPNIASFKTTPKDFTCNPKVLVGSDYIAFQGDKDIRVWSLPEKTNGVISQDELFKIHKEVMPKVQDSLWRLYQALPIILATLTLIGSLLMNFWYGWILGIVVKLAHLDTNPETKNKYWIALFFGSVLSIINMVLFWIYEWRIDFPFSGSIIIAVAGIGYLKWRETQVDMAGDPEMAVTEVKPRRVVKKSKK